MTSYDEIAELATQADQQNAGDQPKGIGTAEPTRGRPSRSRASAEWAGDDPAREGLVDTPARVVRCMKNFSPAMMITPKRCLPAPLKRLRDMTIW